MCSLRNPTEKWSFVQEASSTKQKGIVLGFPKKIELSFPEFCVIQCLKSAKFSNPLLTCFVSVEGYTLLSLFFLACFDSAPRSGPQVYSTYCVHCHQNTGAGIPNLYPPLHDEKWLEGDRPILILLHGLRGEITIQDKKYNNVMASWGGVLSDDEIAAVLTYVRSSWGNNLPPVDPKRVQQLREKHKGRLNWRADSLDKELKVRQQD